MLAWGRIGDAILWTAGLDLLRARTGRRVVVAGRPETAPVVAPHADAFVPLPRHDDPADLAAFAAATAGPWFAVLGDLHVFHGGIGRLESLLAHLPARHRLAYAGYAPPRAVAPSRPWPRGVEVVAALAKGTAPGMRHVLFDTAHYLEHVLARLGAPGAVEPHELAPHLEVPPMEGLLAGPADVSLAGGGDVVACQPFSHNRKKDWPEERWRHLFAAFPDRRFVLLGGRAERERARCLSAPNVDDRVGTTDLTEALAALARAAAFVGADSGLAHAAAALRRPTVVVSHASNLGYFFPYPAALGFDHVRAVHDARFEACSGCIAVCSKEPLWRTYTRGALCLRQLEVEPVAHALRAALAPAPEATVTVTQG